MNDHMVEVQRCRQISGERRRRWFPSNKLDLIVWFSDESNVSGFQLCFKDKKGEKAFSWFNNTGYQHDCVDDGEGCPGRAKMSPVLFPNGRHKLDEVLALFENQSQSIDSSISDIIRQRLLQYCGHENE